MYPQERHVDFPVEPLLRIDHDVEKSIVARNSQVLVSQADRAVDSPSVSAAIALTPISGVGRLNRLCISPNKGIPSPIPIEPLLPPPKPSTMPFPRLRLPLYLSLSKLVSASPLLVNQLLVSTLGEHHGEGKGGKIIKPEDPPDSPAFVMKLCVSVLFILLGGVFAG